ncbi:hypothetical protein [Salinarimonas ramus]|uniref:Uncharacterized protein n=1 Tax=Salinarimonas ramus TaxID=690164 RepID=A0A917V2Z8_9HYPH|nr:hypothetical protein [Salinarimonas ramus]GGK27939.1 hypothetical protein GCM10011322_13080 [Salinarimonas ramus]
MTDKTISVLGWGALAVLLVAAGALLLPACGLRLGPIEMAWCAPPARAAAATPEGDLDDLLLQVQALEDALIARPICDPPPVRRAEAPPPLEPEPEPDRPQIGDDLVLPDNEGDLSFLQGCWESPQNSNIIQGGTNIPIRVRYCFTGSDGSGTVEILNSRDGDCRGPMQARREGDRLLIEYERAICERNGAAFVPGVIECREGANQATCDLIEIRDGVREPRSNQVRDTTLRRID